MIPNFDEPMFRTGVGSTTKQFMNGWLLFGK